MVSILRSGHELPPLIGTSTKMNLTSTEAGAYFADLRRGLASVTLAELFVLPPFTSIWLARDTLTGSNISWGGQDVHADDSGAHTGDISAAMLADLGCRFVECGHSERRRDHGESDADVAAKTRQILRNGMTPVVCVGEPTRGSLDEAIGHVLAQVAATVSSVEPTDISSVVIAYEPVWAIGVGAEPARPEHVEAVHVAIHEALASRSEGGRPHRVIYGGSVDPGTSSAILERPGVDGLFVGRSALDAANFVAIASIAESIWRSHRS